MKIKNKPWSHLGFTKDQLISKQNCRAITSQKNKRRISTLEVYYFKVSTKESLSSFKKKSLCIGTIVDMSPSYIFTSSSI